ncbi:MAG: FAD-dependent oxidoreductase, partial [Verrucomicrobiota bacterium]
MIRSLAFAASSLLFLVPLVAQDREIEADLLVVGATESGWAAAVTAVRLGVPKIVIVHDGEWFGGQFTEQGIACVSENTGVGEIGWGPDWHPVKRSFHRSGLFREVMDQIEWGNAAAYGSRMPGFPLLGPSTFLPSEAEAIFRKIMEPYLKSGRVEVFWNFYPEEALVDRAGERPRLLGMTFRNAGNPGMQKVVKARTTIDASEWGEAIRLSGATYFAGPDPFSRFGEPSAPVEEEGLAKNEMNSLTWAMILEQTEDPSPMAEPPGYDARAFSRSNESEKKDEDSDMIQRRRLVDGFRKADQKTILLLAEEKDQGYPVSPPSWEVASILESMGTGASQKSLIEMTREQREILFADAKNQALRFLYHRQKKASERGEAMSDSILNFQLRDEFGTTDRLPPKPFLPESVRLKALYMMREQDGRNRDGETKEAAKDRFSAVLYPDGLFAWQGPSEVQEMTRVFLDGKEKSGSWRAEVIPARTTNYLTDRSVFPARSLIPQEVDGLLGAQMNLGVSRLVGAALGRHDQNIHVGQAAAALAAVSLR